MMPLLAPAWASLCVVAFLNVVGGQDLFLSTRQSDAQDNSPSGKLGTKWGHDGWVFSFVLHSNPNLCWDLPSEAPGTELQIWECNGHEGQLFYFDDGTFNIKYAGDSSMCLDASDLLAGTKLFIWDCNDLPQQKFGYWDFDSYGNAGRISVGQSESSHNCIDVAGRHLKNGGSLEIWKCNGLPQQSFDLKSGITIRSGENYSVCLDLTGGAAVNGADVEIWECNGWTNQQWIFESGTDAIKWAGDPDYCVDSGGLTEGRSLFLWQCNGMDQQMWGYQNGQIISIKEPTLCIDLPGGSLDSGTVAELWSCNGCWNQMWAVVGPASMALANARLANNLDSNYSNAAPFSVPNYQLGVDPPEGPVICPPKPGPGPSPSPGTTTLAPLAPTNVLMPSCTVQAPGWPEFKSAVELNADAEWSSYFIKIYGEVPQFGYPICVGAFTQIATRGGQTTETPQHCSQAQPTDGQLVDRHSDCCDPKGGVVSFLYNSKNVGNSVPANHWAEVMHVSFKQDKDAAWYYLMFGSAIWWNVGNTKVYLDHPEASLGLIGTACQDDTGHTGTPTECEQDFQGWFNYARQNSIDSIQITHHYDCGCGAPGTSSWTGHNRLCQTEIIDVHGHGNAHGGCASSAYKAGWMATKDCTCNSGLEYTNCNGYGLR